MAASSPAWRAGTDPERNDKAPFESRLREDTLLFQVRPRSSEAAILFHFALAFLCHYERLNSFEERLQRSILARPRCWLTSFEALPYCSLAKFFATTWVRIWWERSWVCPPQMIAPRVQYLARLRCIQQAQVKMLRVHRYCRCWSCAALVLMHC
jgi:hypothetical protein